MNIIVFAMTYLYVSEFLALSHIKTKKRNSMGVEDDMRLALLNTQPQISQLAAQIKVNHHIEHKSLNANKYMQYNFVLIFYYKFRETHEGVGVC